MQSPDSHTPHDPPGPRDRRRRAAVYAAAIALVAVAAIGWLILRELQTLRQQVVQLDEQVSAAEERANQATRRAVDAETDAENASARANAAEQLAAEESASRLAAEDARRAAETEADFSRQETDRIAEIAREAQAEAERVRAERERELARLQGALGQIADTRRTALGLVMNLGEEAINFDFDKAVLKPSERELLSRVVGVLLTYSGYKIQVFGHTDDVGTDSYNQRLSERRAQAVTDYLAAAGIDPSIIETTGFGKTKPLVEETTETARARNRRVELGIIDTVVNYTTEPPLPRRQQ